MRPVRKPASARHQAQRPEQPQSGQPQHPQHQGIDQIDPQMEPGKTGTEGEHCQHAAGYPVGVKPKANFVPGKRNDGPDADVCDAVMYRMADGSLRPGSYFFHYDCDSKPGPREEAKARAFMSDVIEDYFMTYDGVPNPPLSEILSLS